MKVLRIAMFFTALLFLSACSTSTKDLSNDMDSHQDTVEEVVDVGAGPIIADMNNNDSAIYSIVPI